MSDKIIDLDELLNGKPTWEQVVAFWKEGEFCEEHYLVEAIEKHLQTEEQRQLIFANFLSIEKILNGRYILNQSAIVISIFNDWNTKLGFKAFGS